MDSDNHNPAPAGESPESAPEPDLTQAVEGLIARHGNAREAIAVLLSENHGYRNRIRDLRAQVPADDAAVLSADEAKLWEQFQALGSAEELAARIQERDAFAARLKEYDRKELLAEAARLHGYDPEVLAQLPGAESLEFRLSERTVDGKAATFAQVALGDDAFINLDRYAEQVWPKFLPALEARPLAHMTARGTPPRRPNPMPNLRLGHAQPRSAGSPSLGRI